MQMAYPDSAETMDDLADVYLADGQKVWPATTPNGRWPCSTPTESRCPPGLTRNQKSADTRQDLEDVLKKTAQ